MKDKVYVSSKLKETMDRIAKNQVDSWIKKAKDAKEAERKAKEEAKLQRNYRKWLNRRVDKITVRVNDGTNQCLPPQAWLILGQRLAA